jgi:ABC-type multidrug transport system fused ATPase/permease subunit
VTNTFRSCRISFCVSPGQRIVARLRESTYSAALRQDVEFVERGEGDVLSRLSVDTSIVGERFLWHLHHNRHFMLMWYPVLLRTYLMVYARSSCRPLAVSLSV